MQMFENVTRINSLPAQVGREPTQAVNLFTGCSAAACAFPGPLIGPSSKWMVMDDRNGWSWVVEMEGHG